VKDQWKDANIDLGELSKGVEQFFIQRQFEDTLEKTEKGYKIEAKTEKVFHAQLKILVNIFGGPNDFTIEYTTSEQGKGFFNRSMIFSYIAQALGGGAIFRGEVKLRDALEKIEKEFWSHVDKQVALLSNSVHT
jgi:hypothetical protein